MKRIPMPQSRWHAAQRLEERYNVDDARTIANRLREQIRTGVDCWQLHPRDARVWRLPHYFVLCHGSFYIAIYDPISRGGNLVTILATGFLAQVNLPKLRAALGKRGRRAVAQDADLKRRFNLAGSRLTE